MKKNVRVQPMKSYDRAGVLIQTPFSLDFVRTLKAMVPFNHRLFNEHRSGWWISDEYSEVIIHLASQHFGGAEVKDANGERIMHSADGERCRQEVLFR